MNLEEKQHLIPEPLRGQFVAWARLKTEAERESFWEQSKLENAGKSEAEQATLQAAWLEGIQILRNEVQAIGDEIRAAKAAV